MRLLNTQDNEITSPPDKPMIFEYQGNGGNAPGCEWILASGSIIPSTSFLLDSLIRERWPDGFLPTIYFHSKGGDLLSGLRIGKIIRDRGGNTGVGVSAPNEYGFFDLGPGICASAAVFALIGGVKRFIGDSDKIGLHQFYDPRALIDPSSPQFTGEESIKQQATMGILTYYTRSMGINTDLLFIASQTHPSEVTWLSRKQCIELQIDNVQQNFSDWSIIPYQGGVAAIAETRLGPDDPDVIKIYSTTSGTVIIHHSRYYFGLKAEELARSASSYLVEIGEMRLRSGDIVSAIQFSTTSDGAINIQYILSRTEAQKLLNADSIRVELEVPGCFGHFFGAGMSLKGARECIRLAMQNPIQGSKM